MNKSIIYLCMLFAMVFISCGDKWDEYYNGNDGSKEEELDQTLQEFFAEHNEYNAFYKELELCGLDEELTKDQQLTLWVVNDDAMAASGIEKDDTLRMKLSANNQTRRRSVRKPFEGGVLLPFEERRSTCNQ